MDLRTRTSLFCGALAIAIAASILLRKRPGMPQIWFAGFAADTGLWYLAQWLYLFVLADVWARFTAILAVLLPQFALRLFEALMPEKERRSTLPRVALILLGPVALLALVGPLSHWWVRGTVFLYVFGLLGAGLYSLWARSRDSKSRGTQRRVRFLVIVGALAVAASLADFLWFSDLKIPPIGRTGTALTVAGALFIAWYLRRHAAVRPISRELDFSGTLAAYRADIARRMQIGRGYLWWYLLPIMTGPAIWIVGGALLEPGGKRRAIVAAAVFIAIALVMRLLPKAQIARAKRRFDQLAQVSEKIVESGA